MRNITLRNTGKGTAVVLEQVTLIDKKLFNTYQEAVAYAATINVYEAFNFKTRTHTRNAEKESTSNKNS